MSLEVDREFQTREEGNAFRHRPGATLEDKLCRPRVAFVRLGEIEQNSKSLTIDPFSLLRLGSSSKHTLGIEVKQGPRPHQLGFGIFRPYLGSRVQVLDPN